MEKICKNCQYWVKWDRPFHTCDCSVDNPETAFEVDGEAWDDSGLQVWLRTGPNFGCVHFKLRKSLTNSKINAITEQ